MQHIAMHFGISVPLVHKVIHRNIPYLHSYIVPKYIHWHSMAHWRHLAGYFPEWPTVVAILDCTPFRINKPKGNEFLLLWRIKKSLNFNAFTYHILHIQPHDCDIRY